MRRLAIIWIVIGMYLLLLLGLSGCGYHMVYMLDQPVSDPMMYADDTQDSDLCRVEDGGYSGSAGECPT